MNRSQMIRTAHALPKGSLERRKILALLKTGITALARGHMKGTWTGSVTISAAEARGSTIKLEGVVFYSGPGYGSRGSGGGDTRSFKVEVERKGLVFNLSKTTGDAVMDDLIRRSLYEKGITSYLRGVL